MTNTNRRRRVAHLREKGREREEEGTGRQRERERSRNGWQRRWRRRRYGRQEQVEEKGLRRDITGLGESKWPWRDGNKGRL